MMHGEFDNYIDGYRKNLDEVLTLSGESSFYFAELKVQKLINWIPELCNKDVTILDFGCGDGVMTNLIAHYCEKATVYGVDPSAKSIHEAQQKNQIISFSVNSDISTTLNFNDNMFDVITAAGAFHHIPFELHEGYMSELRRILKPGGCLVVFELNPLNPLTRYTFKHNPIDFNAEMLTPWYAYRLGKKYGKASIKFYCFFPRVMRILRVLEAYMAKIPLSALYALIVKKYEIYD